MKAIEKMYDRWQGYISHPDIKKQFKKDCAEVEQQIKKLKDEIKRLTDLNTCNSCKKLKVVLD